MVPPMTESPAVLVTGIDSPVTSDSSTVDRPSSTVPSTGTASPGRTRSRSPSRTSSNGTSASEPSAASRRAVFGVRSSSALIAPEVCSRARSSSTCPNNTSTVMTAAGSKYTSTAPSSRKPSGKIPGHERGHHAEHPGHPGAHRDQREHVQVPGPHRVPARGRRTATRPTAPPASPAPAGSTPRPAVTPDRPPRRPGPGPSPAAPPAPSTRPRPRTGDSCRPAPRSDPSRRSPPPAPTPSRRSGTTPAQAGGSADASGTSTRPPPRRPPHPYPHQPSSPGRGRGDRGVRGHGVWGRRERARQLWVHRGDGVLRGSPGGTGPGQPRTGPGNRMSRTRTTARRARSGLGRRPAPSSRTPGPSSLRWPHLREPSVLP